MRTLAFLFLLAVGSTAGADDAAKALLEKALSAHGGADVLGKVKAGTFAVRGTIAMAGSDIPCEGEVAFLLPDKSRISLTLDAGVKVETLQIVSGDKVAVKLNGKTQLLTEAQKAEARGAIDLQEMTLLAPLLDEKRFAIKTGKPNPRAPQLTATAGDRPPATLAFEPKTLLLNRVTRGTESTQLGDFRAVDVGKVGKAMVPMRMTTTRDGKKYLDLFVTSAVLAEKMDPKAFAIPD
jgi:hypothetical protein